MDFHIPTNGVKEDKINAFKDLISRYLCDDDPYNNKAVHDGLFKALSSLDKDPSLLEMIRAIDPSISGFQLNWVMNTLAEYSVQGQEIKTLWEKYQKGLEPKKKASRKYKTQTLDLNE